MRALIKKYPTNCNAKYKEEVILEPFPETVQRDIDDYLDNYHYALCENVPDHEVVLYDIDQRTNVNNYQVSAYDYKPSEEEESRVRYKATWVWS